MQVWSSSFQRLKLRHSHRTLLVRWLADSCFEGKNGAHWRQMASQKIEKEQKGSAKQTLMSTRRPPKLSKDDLKHMVEEATVDAYGDSEQVCGFYTMLENDLQLPFNTALLGAEVTVERIDLTDDDRWVYPCRSGRRRDGNGSRPTGTGHGRFRQPATW